MLTASETLRATTDEVVTARTYFKRRRGGRLAPNPDAPIRAVGYIRVSTDDQKLGPEAQRAAIEKWCGDQGFELVGICSDLGVSGTTPIDRRKGFMDLIPLIDKTGAQAIVVAKLDRLARDAMVAAIAEHLIGRLGCVLRSVAGEGTDSDNPAAMLQKGMMQLLAAYERALIAARTAAALQVKVARHEQVGLPKYGWRRNDEGGAMLPDIREREGAAVARKLYQDHGYGYERIGRILPTLGYPPRPNRRKKVPDRWWAQSVQRLMAAPEEGVDADRIEAVVRAALAKE